MLHNSSYIGFQALQPRKAKGKSAKTKRNKAEKEKRAALAGKQDTGRKIVQRAKWTARTSTFCRSIFVPTKKMKKDGSEKIPNRRCGGADLAERTAALTAISVTVAGAPGIPKRGGKQSEKGSSRWV